MHLQIECPACKSGLHVSLDSVGTWTRCRYCTAKLKVPPPGMNVSDWSPGQPSIPVTDDHIVPNAIRQPALRLFSVIWLELTKVCSAITRAVSPNLNRAGHEYSRRIWQTQPQRVHWTTSRILTYLAFFAFAVALLQPAAMIEDWFPSQSNVPRYVVGYGLQLLIMAVLGGILRHPVLLLYTAMNITFIACTVTIFFRPTFGLLRFASTVPGLSTLIAFSGWETVERYLGWWLWVSSFLLLTLAYLTPLVRAPEGESREDLLPVARF